MIVTGVQRKEVEIEINPLDYLIQLIDEWKVVCEMCVSDNLNDAGYWTNRENKNIRLATPEEIKQFKAFKVVASFVREIA